MVSSTGCDYTSLLLLFGEVPKRSSCSPYFETPDGLQIFPLQEDIGLIFFREVGGPLELSVGDNKLIEAIGLVYLRSRDKLGLTMILHL